MSRQASSHSRRSPESCDINCNDDEKSPLPSKGKRKAEPTDYNDGDDEDVEFQDRPAKRASSGASTSGRCTKTRSSEPTIKMPSEKRPKYGHILLRSAQRHINQAHELLTEYIELNPSSYTAVYSSSPSASSTLYYGSHPCSAYFTSGTSGTSANSTFFTSSISTSSTSSSSNTCSSFYFSSFNRKVKATPSTSSSSKSSKPPCPVIVIDDNEDNGGDAEEKLDAVEAANRLRSRKENSTPSDRVKTTEKTERPIKAHRSSKRKEMSALRRDSLVPIADEPPGGNMKDASTVKKEVESVKVPVVAVKAEENPMTDTVEKIQGEDSEKAGIPEEVVVGYLNVLLKAVNGLQLGSENEDVNDVGHLVQETNGVAGR